MLPHRKSEEDAAEWFGKRQPLSGADQTKPGDLLGYDIYSQFLLENKRTEKESRSLNLKEIKKISKEARTYCRDWLFRTDFSGLYKIISLSETTFRAIMEELGELRKENLDLKKQRNEDKRIINELRVLLENEHRRDSKEIKRGEY